MMNRSETTSRRETAASIAMSLAKRALRARCRKVRDELGAAFRDQASRRICDLIAAWEGFRSARVVFTYLPMRGEVDLRPLFDHAPHIQWVIPRVVEAPVPHLRFHLYQADRLVRHRYGMLEPDPSAPVVEPELADVILVPGLAYTRTGYRLGYGGGYYDRLLAQPLRAATLGAVYHALLLDEIPHLAHDLPVGYVVSESTGVRPASHAA